MATDEDGGFEVPKTTAVTRMATPKTSIPVTIYGNFEAYCGGQVWGRILLREGGGLGHAALEHIDVCIYVYTCTYHLQITPCIVPCNS